MPIEPIILIFCGGMNNRETPLELFSRKQGEVPLLVNADTTYGGRLKLLRPLLALNNTAEASSIHSILRANNVVLVGTGTSLKYLNGTSLTSILSGLSGDNLSLVHAGNWVYCANGMDKKSIYLTDKTGCDWGHAVPSAAPTVAVGAAGNPNDTYSCYYRYRITLPDGSIILTGLSPVGTVTVASQKIEWSGLVHASFTGATSVQIDLFRTASGWSATYLVTTLDEGTTTYSDNNADATVQANTAFAEEGYYPPPNSPNLAFYHPGTDRMFCAVDNKAYWSEAAKYHIFVYDETANAYSNVNSVFLSGENITSIIIFDEQAYLGSQKTWRRLRGKNPSSWSWEDISGAIKGPMNSQSVAITPWGAVYPGNDGALWIFNGFETNKILEKFIFGTLPTSTARASFDGRFYRLFYGDSTYPELIIDFHDFPGKSPRIIQSTRSATACHYNKESNEYYLGDSSGYLRNGEDLLQDVTLIIRLSDIPIENLLKLGNFPALLAQANTQEDDLTITVYQDQEEIQDLDAFNSESLEWDVLPLPQNQYRTMSLQLSITSKEDIEIREPWVILNEEG